MTDKTMPAELAAIVDCGYAIWASDSIDPDVRARFDSERIPVAGVRQVRVWVFMIWAGVFLSGFAGIANRSGVIYQAEEPVKVTYQEFVGQ